MKTIAMLSLIVLVVFCSNVFAQSDKSTLPPEAASMMSKLVGTWTTDGDRNGEAFTGLYQASWNDAHTGLVYSSREGQDVLFTGISYWDSKTGELVETWNGDALVAVQRFKAVSENRWTGNAFLQLHSGEQKESRNIEINFEDGTFTFSATETGKEEKLVVTNTRIPLQDSEAAFQDLGNFLVGGTWVNSQSNAMHSYKWQPGNKVLVLDRRGGEYPGVSLISVDYVAQAMRWIEIDDSGLSGSAICIPTGVDEWKMFGHYTGKDATQDMLLTITRDGPDSITAKGTDLVNGEARSWIEQNWKRER